MLLTVQNVKLCSQQNPELKRKSNSLPQIQAVLDDVSLIVFFAVCFVARLPTMIINSWMYISLHAVYFILLTFYFFYFRGHHSIKKVIKNQQWKCKLGLDLSTGFWTSYFVLCPIIFFLRLIKQIFNQKMVRCLPFPLAGDPCIRTTSTLRTFAPNSSHVQIFFKLLLQLDNDQLMSERQNNWGVTVLVSEIKHIKDRSVSRSFGHVKRYRLQYCQQKKSEMENSR